MSVTFEPASDRNWARRNHLNVSQDSAHELLDLLRLPHIDEDGGLIQSGEASAVDLQERIAQARNDLARYGCYLDSLERIALRALRREGTVVWG